MTETDEAVAVRRVYEFLCEKFSAVAPEVIEALVIREHARLDGPVRIFVPVLVQRAASEHLREMSRPAEALLIA